MESFLKLSQEFTVSSLSAENLAGYLLAAILLVSQFADIYFNVLPDVLNGSKNVVASSLAGWHSLQKLQDKSCTILRDFSSGRYYKPWGDQNIVLITSLDHFRELCDAPQLSQRAVYADIFNFQYTMRHLETALDPNEQAPHRYKLFHSTIRKNGVRQLPALYPYLQTKLSRAMTAFVESTPKTSDGWHSVKLANLMRSCATGLLGTYFFGDALLSEPGFDRAIQDFYSDTIKCMGALQITPYFAKGTLYRLLTWNGRSVRTIFERLGRAIENEDGWVENEHLQNLTLLHNLKNASKISDYWTTNLLIQAILGIWFAASHQPWMNLHFIILELCNRPEWIERLREELKDNMDFETITHLRLLDSFIKECVRLNPLDRMAIRRKALVPYTFTNGGPFVAKGRVACISAWDIMHDPTRYPKPDEFDGFRFVGTRAGIDTRGSTFTDASKEFPVWGLGARVCPGRWHADAVLKMTLAYILIHFDFRLESPSLRHTWWWETFQMAKENTRVLFRRKVDSATVKQAGH